MSHQDRKKGPFLEKSYQKMSIIKAVPYLTLLKENYFEDEWVDVWNRK